MPGFCELGRLGRQGAILADLEKAGWQPAGLIKLAA